MSTYLVRPARGHFEVVDRQGQIIVTGDTRREAEDAIIEVLADQFRQSTS